MTGFGISVYPDIDSPEDIRAYLKRASTYGCQYVFSSMFSVEGTKEEVLDYFKDLIRDVHAWNMKIVLDLNPPFLKKMGVEYDDIRLFHEIGCDVMRMDLPYGKEKDLILVQNPYDIAIMFNASGSILEELAYFEEHGVEKQRVLLGHNFYPQPYTGLKWNRFLEVNHAIKQYGYPVQCFISSRAKNTHGVWDAIYGLPTVERMRNLPIDLQAREYLATKDVDMVWIGNAFATEKEFEALQEIMKPVRPMEKSPLAKVMASYGLPLHDYTSDIKVKVIPDENSTDAERELLFEVVPQLDFGDSSEWIWRSRSGRMLKPDIPARAYEGAVFEPGSVVIVNNNYSHYAGEVQIVRMPIQNDGTRNLVGMLADHEEELLQLIGDRDLVTFIEYADYSSN